MMKKLTKLATIVLLIGAFSLSAVQAQNSKRAGYVAKQTSYKFKEDKVGIPMKGYYILKDGTEVDAIIAYNKPEFFSGDFAFAFASLYICKELTDKPVNVFNDSDPNHKEFIKPEDLKAFFIDGHLYANVEGVGWRIILTEGAIHSFIQVVKMQKGDKVYYINFKRTQWFQDEPFGSALGSVSTKNHLAMLEKIPPTASAASVSKFNKIVADYKANLISLNEAEIRYNTCFDNNSEMLIDYILGKEGVRKKERDAIAMEQAKLKEEQAKLKAEADAKAAAKEDLRLQSEAGQRAAQAPKQDRFKDRTTTVSPEYASAKPEVKVKKQKFKARIDRIKADGNKVGVIVQCSNIDVNPKSQTFFAKQKPQFVRGTYKPIQGIDQIANQTVETLNKGFGTDVFEVIDLKNIPYKLGLNDKKEDDWWATKYKVIIFYNYNPYYTAFIQESGDSTNVVKEFKAQMIVNSFVFMMAAQEGEKKMKSAGTPPKIASYKSEFYKAKGDTKIWTIQELKPLINPKTDEEIVKHLLEQQQRFLAKFIKKNNK